mmetsp:Transcript_8517/g.24656  ORF Transcript_8517/g.24656 Transcript_8517/m.24656 type:complete len:211 (+) Transcript_8517:107-739(+)
MPAAQTLLAPELSPGPSQHAYACNPSLVSKSSSCRASERCSRPMPGRSRMRDDSFAAMSTTVMRYCRCMGPPVPAALPAPTPAGSAAPSSLLSLGRRRLMQPGSCSVCPATTPPCSSLLPAPPAWRRGAAGWRSVTRMEQSANAAASFQRARSSAQVSRSRALMRAMVSPKARCCCRAHSHSCGCCCGGGGCCCCFPSPTKVPAALAAAR